MGCGVLNLQGQLTTDLEELKVDCLQLSERNLFLVQELELADFEVLSLQLEPARHSPIEAGWGPFLKFAYGQHQAFAQLVPADLELERGAGHGKARSLNSRYQHYSRSFSYFPLKACSDEPGLFILDHTV